MDIINILPDSVANQIAAGEVVDRPASAVKELVENALDAGATEIKIILKDAGRTLIQVIDNGCGMTDSDARLCFERHATSKIKRADDLFAIRTMGFRGEALASIAAVAQVELKTRQHDSQLGTQVLIDGSQLREQTPCSCPVGTSIAVKNLFFNIPARRNFLKKDSIEMSHIEEVFKRIALPNHEVAFSMHAGDRVLYDLKPSNFAQRISALFGKNYNERLYRIEESTQPVKLFGYVGKAEFAKRSRGEQYLFVDGRFIKHPALSAAIEKAYAELIPDHTYPAYFVMLDVDPSRIDVNIHPTKTEVRFIDESVIFSILRAATKKSLGQFSLSGEIEFNPSTEIDFTPAGKDYVVRPPEVSYNPHFNPFSSHQQSSHSSRTSTFFGESNAGDNVSDPSPSGSTAVREDIADSSAVQSVTHTQLINFANRYIITTLKSGVVVIDQTRAHERILYERLLAASKAAAPSAQQLLFPVNCRFSSADSDILGELLTTLNQMGFAISPLTSNTYVVTATPPHLSETDIQTTLEQTISDYKNFLLKPNTSDRDQAVCISLARHMAVKAGTPLKQEEMQQIIADLFSCRAPHTSPSGKKTMIVISEADFLERFA